MTSAAMPPTDAGSGPGDGPEAGGDPVPRPYTARSIRIELIIVFLVTLGLSGLYSLVDLVDALLAPIPLASQTVSILVPQAQASLLDLVKQLLVILRGFAWGALGLYLLWRSGVNLRTRLGLDLRKPWADLGVGVGTGGRHRDSGAALLPAGRAARHQPDGRPDHAERRVVAVAGADPRGDRERLPGGGAGCRVPADQARPTQGAGGRSRLRSARSCAARTTSYQGFGGFLGNAVMGVVFAWWFRRTRRLWPLVIAHSLLDITVFVGYSALRGTVSWLP